LGEKVGVGGIEPPSRRLGFESRRSRVEQRLEVQALPGEGSELPEEWLHPFDTAANPLNLVRWKVEKRPVVKPAEVHPIEHAIEEVGPLLHACGDLLHRSLHPRGVVAFHDADHIVVIAERIQVFLPALLALFFRAEQVVSLGVILHPNPEKQE